MTVTPGTSAADAAGLAGLRRALVIGLGASGLAAARLLRAHGSEVRVAEARNHTARLERMLRELADADVRVRHRLAYTGIVSDTLEPPVVAEAVEAFILSDPTLRRLVDGDALKDSDPERRRAALTRIADGLRRLALETPRYRCESCGYTTQQLVWQCPSCKSWDTGRPLTDFPYAALIARGEPRQQP